MSCWNVGRFVQRIVSASTPDVNRMRSPMASARHDDGAGPCAVSSSAAAASSAPHNASRHDASTPAPQYRREYWTAHLAPEQRAQVLVHVAVPARDVRRAAGVRVVAPRVHCRQPTDQRSEHGGDDGVGQPRPRGVHHCGAGIVDLSVELTVEPARPGQAPVVDEPRSRLGTGARRRAGLEHGTDDAARRERRAGSWVAALFIALTSVASECFFFPRRRRAGGRCDAPSRRRSSSRLLRRSRQAGCSSSVSRPRAG